MFNSLRLLFAIISTLIVHRQALATNYLSIEQEIRPATGPDLVRESRSSAQRIKEAQARLNQARIEAAKAQAAQNNRYQRQLEADRKADIEIAKINAQTKKYQKDLAIAEFNKRRSEISLAYAKAKTGRQKKYQQKVYQRKIAAERESRASRN